MLGGHRTGPMLGALVSPFPVRVSGPGAYYLVTSAAKSELPRVKVFRRWLLDQV